MHPPCMERIPYDFLQKMQSHWILRSESTPSEAQSAHFIISEAKLHYRFTNYFIG